MKRMISVLLALCLVCAPRARAAESLALRYQESRDGVELTLTGLEGEIYALQLELELEGECAEADFRPSAADVYSPECRVEESGRGRTRVTIYMVADGAPLSGKTLRLGTLESGDRFSLPSRGELLILDQDLKPVGGESRSVSLSREGGSSSSSGSGSGKEEIWRIHIAPLEHGAVTVRPTSAKKGETVTLTVAPEAGYTLREISAEDDRDREVRLTAGGLNRYTFSMPEGDVEVTASFTGGGGLTFLDVVPGDWCYDAVRYVFEAGLMNGVSAQAFSPNTTTTRGQIVAILYRLEGSPAAGTSRFSDVGAGAYYAAAVSWASDRGIVNGYGDGTFRPGNPITREQMAAFLYRYAVYKGRDVSDQVNLSAFADGGEAASYAVEPLRWAVGAGLINGVAADRLAPGGSATRAQVAAILTRFVQNVF